MSEPGGERADQREKQQPRELLGGRRRRLAWIGFLVLAAYAPVVAWLDPGDTWMAPVAVAAIIGYAIVVDDVLRHRAARTATVSEADAGTVDRAEDSGQLDHDQH